VSTYSTEFDGSQDFSNTLLGLRPTIGIQCENVAYHSVDGRRDTCRLPQLDDSATEPIHFQPVATLQIIMHRGSNLRWETIAEGETILSVFGAEGDALRTIVARSCQLKADVVACDEREETGRRAVLNFGHTVGHAIEAVAGYGGPYLHGEAVAAGMVAECRMAEHLSWITPEVTTRLIALLLRFGLPTATPGLDPASLLEAMTRDKKNQRGQIRFVLPRALGQVELTGDVGAELMRLVVSDLCAKGNDALAVSAALHSDAPTPS